MENKKYLISSIDKALNLLIFLSNNKRTSLKNLERALNIPKSSLYRILRTLEEKDFVRQDNNDNYYSLGFKILELSRKLKEGLSIRNVAYPFLKELYDQYQETIQLAVVNKETILIIESIEGVKDIRVFSPVGRKLPITYGNFAKVFLSQMTDDDILSLLVKYPLKKYAENSIMDNKIFLKEVKKVKERNVAIGINDPIDAAFSVVVPIFGQRKEIIIACICISGGNTPENLGKLLEIESSLKKASMEISKQMGFSDVYINNL